MRIKNARMIFRDFAEEIVMGSSFVWPPSIFALPGLVKRGNPGAKTRELCGLFHSPCGWFAGRWSSKRVKCFILQLVSGNSRFKHLTHISTELARRLQGICKSAYCKKCVQSAILVRFEQCWRSSAGRASDL